MSDVVSIQEQARRSFFQWHVLLLMKKKQLEATLEDAGYRPEVVQKIEENLPPVFDSDELALLQSIGLPIAGNLSQYDLPNQERVDGIRFFFHSASALEGLPKERAGRSQTSRNPWCRDTPVGVAHKKAASHCPPSASSLGGPTEERTRPSLRASKSRCRDTATRRYSKATL